MRNKSPILGHNRIHIGHMYNRWVLQHVHMTIVFFFLFVCLFQQPNVIRDIRSVTTLDIRVTILPDEAKSSFCGKKNLNRLFNTGVIPV